MNVKKLLVKSALVTMTVLGSIEFCSSIGAQSGNCWTYGSTPCSTCGLGGSTCAATACVPMGVLGVLTCPAGASETFRQFPAGTTVRACKDVLSGKLTCSTAGGTTTWCAGTRPCSSTGGTGVCGLVPGTLPSDPRFCVTAVGGVTSNACGLTSATLGMQNCPSGS